MPSHSNPDVLLSFILLLLIASFTAYYANRKGRHPVLWFIIGILLGLFAPLILLFLSSVKDQASSDGSPTMNVSNPHPALKEFSQTQLETQSLSPDNEKLWYYLDQEHQQMGPVSIIALKSLWNRGLLELTSYVWSDGMEQWERIENLPELKASLDHSGD